jgi:transcriptional regulator GlxA family with amidase domain
MLFEACREQALHPPGWEHGITAVVTRVLLELVRRDPRLGAPVGGGRDTGALERLLPALEAMRQDLAAPLPVAELASRCGLSEAQFRRIFQKAMGMSPVQHQRRLRIEEACRLLESTRLPLHEISRRVGYAEPSFFQRTFAELMGAPPGRWRERQRKGWE